LIYRQKCRDKNNTVRCAGKCSSKREEGIQIDISSKLSAPKIAEYGKKYVKGQTCENVLIQGNDVKGGMAIGVNWENKNHPNAYHKNVTIRKNKAIGLTSNGIQAYNCIGLTVADNTAVCRYKKNKKDHLYAGIHIENTGKKGFSKALKNSVINITGNTAKGAETGIYVGCSGKSSDAYRVKEIVCAENKGFSRVSAADGIIENMIYNCSKTAVYEKNKLKKW